MAARERGAWAALAGGVLAALLPKCPPCLPAWLSGLGAAAGSLATVAPALRPLGLVLATVSAGLLAWWRLRRGGRPRRHST